MRALLVVSALTAALAAEVRDKMRFHPVSTLHEVLTIALEPDALAKAA